MPEFRVAFTAHDYGATVAFFRDVMGCGVLRSFPGGTILLAADGQVEVFEPGAGWGEPGVSGVFMAWEVADADAEHARLVAAGAELLSEPTDQPWGHRNFSVRGPDGWTITLYQIVLPQ